MSLIPKKGTVYVVDDDEAVRDSLQWLLEGKDYRVRCFDSAESFLSRYDARDVACLIVDVRMGGMNGLGVLEQLRLRRSPLVVLFLSGHGDIPMALEAMRLGAFDWVVKPDTAQLLAKLPAALVEAGARADALLRWGELTPREREVARQVGLGLPNKEIARLLDPPCSPRSVETHRAHLFAKLGLGNDNELGRWLARHAWLVAEPG